MKSNNVQVNHIAARGENTLCVAFMNECSRELTDVAVKLTIPAGNYQASVWRDNQREATKLIVTNGSTNITLSAKGITALVIEGVNVRAPFQGKFTGKPSPANAIMQQCITTPYGEALAMILSFGPELTWLYAYLTADRGTVKSAKLNMNLPNRRVTLTDDDFPFEFSWPLKPNETPLQLSFEVTRHDGETKGSEAVVSGRGFWRS